MTVSIDVSATFAAPGADRFSLAAALTVDRGETVVVLGPSGSGKTLLLEVVAGFHTHQGTVTTADRDLTNVPPEDRDFGFVFQDYALFPHMTVAENVRYGGRYREDTADIAAVLSALGIGDLVDRHPRTLSGGEKQRVALARSLYVEPGVLLLDEPLSSLDVPTRAALRQDLADTLENQTAVYVTHDRTTARILADRIVVLRDGAIVQRGPPRAVFDRPSSPFVARFTGSNCLPLSDGALALPDGGRLAVGDGSHLAVRPEDVELDPPDPDFVAPVAETLREEGRYRVTLAVAGERLDAFAPVPPDGDEVGVALPRDRLTVLED